MLVETRVKVADIAVDAKSGGGDAIWTYRLDSPADLGDAFFVPLGSRAVIGYAIRIYETDGSDLDFPLDQLRPVLNKVEGLSLPAEVLDLVRHTAAEYLCPLTVALSAAVPPGIRDRLLTAWTLETEAAPDTHLTPMQKEVLQTLKDSGGTLYDTKGKKLQQSSVRALRLLRSKGLVRHSLQVKPFRESRKELGLLRLSSDTEQIESFLRKQGKKKPAQALTLMRLQTADPVPLAPQEVRALTGVTDITIRALLDAGLLLRVDEKDFTPRKPPPPNPYQQLAIDAIVDTINAREFKPYLLYGVTGSGKTEVFLRAAAEALRQGRQVLYLVPEIALAAQAITLLRERFGKNVAVIHSELSAKERLETWMQVREGDAAVVMGPRSALFAPLTNLGLVIVDEEHESSYKQESSPRYHAKNLALFLGKRHGAAVVLGSATPNVESYYEAEQGELELLSLPERAASARLPSVHIEDLSEGYRAGQPKILTEVLLTHLDEVLLRKEQAILFMNRRAYAPFLTCRDCGHQFKCPRCAVSLSYSRRDRRLRCHHCGHNIRPPDKCPSCAGDRLSPLGIGTERVEEAVKEACPTARVVRLDRDIAQKKGALEQILAQFRSGDLDVLVGTQMVAKGLDFPNVTLVGVIVADTSLNIPDFRASERTFQLLGQVAGRAGRGSLPGHVVIQTFNPDHVAVQCAKNHDYLSFYQAIIDERSSATYPPFATLVNVVFSGDALELVSKAGEQAALLLSERVSFTDLLGPTDCALERLQNRWRHHLVLKLARGASVEPVRQALAGFQPKGVQVVIDVDPYSMI